MSNAPLIIGLTGLRQVGKSSIADHLVDNHGFRRLHPFEGGKVATRAWLEYLGADADTAWRMTETDLKETPSDLLPNCQTPRFFMEQFGHFMGVGLGPDWTIGRSLQRAKKEDTGNGRFVIESVVYEVEPVREEGGLIIKIEASRAKVTGLKTDIAVAAIVPDSTFVNEGFPKSDVGERFDAHLLGMGIPLPALDDDHDFAMG